MSLDPRTKKAALWMGAIFFAIAILFLLFVYSGLGIFSQVLL